MNLNKIRIVWIAIRPPIPPFSGITIKTLSGIEALTKTNDIDLITFSIKNKHEEIENRLVDYWKNRNIKLNLIDYGKRLNSIKAAIKMRFQLSTEIERSTLPYLLDEMQWDNKDRMLIFDDIVFAPLIIKYGKNAVLSPHDCISEMHRSHFMHSSAGMVALRHFAQYFIARYYEKSFYHRSLLTHVLTNRDKFRLQKINNKARYFVIPFEDLDNPGFIKRENYHYDILIWGNLSIPSISRGVRQFLKKIKHNKDWLSKTKIVIVGRIPIESVKKNIGMGIPSSIEYKRYLEDSHDNLTQAKITLVPDVGGAGIKNRCINVLNSGNCLACLYQQMDGIEKAIDKGAINANNMSDLTKRIKTVLAKNLYCQIGEDGESIFRREYNRRQIQNMWSEMMEYALEIRSKK